MRGLIKTIELQSKLEKIIDIYQEAKKQPDNPQYLSLYTLRYYELRTIGLHDEAVYSKMKAEYKLKQSSP